MKVKKIDSVPVGGNAVGRMRQRQCSGGCIGSYAVPDGIDNDRR